MGFKTITQLALVLTAVIVVLTYVQPTFLSVKDKQDVLFSYTDTVNKAAQLNTDLNALLQKEKSFLPSDIDRLETYLPSDIDDMAVMADIAVMGENAGVTIDSLTLGEVIVEDRQVIYDEEDENQGIVREPETLYKDFVVVVSAQYDAYKRMLLALEQNKYPLEVVTLEFISPVLSEATIGIPTNELIGIYEMTLRTYSYTTTN